MYFMEYEFTFCMNLITAWLAIKVRALCVLPAEILGRLCTAHDEWDRSDKQLKK